MAPRTPLRRGRAYQGHHKFRGPMVMRGFLLPRGSSIIVIVMIMNWNCVVGSRLENLRPLAAHGGSLLPRPQTLEFSMRRHPVAGVSGPGRLSLRREGIVPTLRYSLRGGGDDDAGPQRGTAEQVPGKWSIEDRANHPNF